MDRQDKIIMIVVVTVLVVGSVGFATYSYLSSLPPRPPPVLFRYMNVVCQTSSNQTPAPCVGGYYASFPVGAQTNSSFTPYVRVGLAPFSFNVTAFAVAPPFRLLAPPTNLPLYVPAENDSAPMWPILVSPSLPGTYDINVTLTIAR
jgi:hypothetical protein